MGFIKGFFSLFFKTIFQLIGLVIGVCILALVSSVIQPELRQTIMNGAIDVAGYAEFDFEKYIQRYEIINNQEQSKKQKLISNFIEDLSWLSSKQFFSSTKTLTKLSDVSSVLNPQLDWKSPKRPEYEQPGFSFFIQKEFLSIENQWQSWQWLQHIDEYKKQTLSDASIFQQLSAFNTWNLNATAPISTAIQNREIGINRPAPQLTPLLSLIKIELSKVQTETEAKEKLIQLIQIAKTLYSAELLTANEHALRTLEIGYQIRQYWEHSRGWAFKDTQFDVLDQQFIQTSKRVFNAWMSFYDFSTSIHELNQIDKAPVEYWPGLCAVIQEKQERFEKIRAFAEQVYSIEFKKLDAMAASTKSACSLKARAIEPNLSLYRSELSAELKKVLQQPKLEFIVDFVLTPHFFEDTNPNTTLIKKGLLLLLPHTSNTQYLKLYDNKVATQETEFQNFLQTLKPPAPTIEKKTKFKQRAKAKN